MIVPGGGHAKRRRGAVRGEKKRGDRGAVRVRPPGGVAGGGAAIAKTGKRPPRHNLPIRLHGQSLHGAVRTGIEAGLKRPIRIKSSEPAAGSGPDTTAPEGGEISAE